MFANRLASISRFPLTSLLNGALRLAHHFGNSAQFWPKLQTRYDLLTREAEIDDRIKVEIVVAKEVSSSM